MPVYLCVAESCQPQHPCPDVCQDLATVHTGQHYKALCVLRQRLPIQGKVAGARSVRLLLHLYPCSLIFAAG